MLHLGLFYFPHSFPYRSSHSHLISLLLTHFFNLLYIHLFHYIYFHLDFFLLFFLTCSSSSRARVPSPQFSLRLAFPPLHVISRLGREWRLEMHNRIQVEPLVQLISDTLTERRTLFHSYVSQLLISRPRICNFTGHNFILYILSCSYPMLVIRFSLFRALVFSPSFFCLHTFSPNRLPWWRSDV